jgi:hypothetical protein
LLSSFAIGNPGQRRVLLLLILSIKMNVCLYETYTNPHFLTDLKQTLHTSPPWSGGGRRLCMDPKYFNFPNFSTYFVGSECRFVRGRWLPAPETPLLHYIPCWCDVTGVTCTVHNTQKTRRSERNAYVWKWKPDGTGRKWIMNCTCNCIAFIQMITKNLSNFRLFSFRMLLPSQHFPLFQRDVSLKGWQYSAANPESNVYVCVRVRVCAHAHVSRRPQCLHETFFDLNLFRPLWEMFHKWHDNTVIHASHMGNYMMHARGSEILQTFTFWLLTGKERTSVTFQTDGNITILLHVFAFLLIVE